MITFTKNYFFIFLGNIFYYTVRVMFLLINTRSEFSELISICSIQRILMITQTHCNCYEAFGDPDFLCDFTLSMS
jgi:hypothetical protein